MFFFRKTDTVHSKLTGNSPLPPYRREDVTLVLPDVLLFRYLLFLLVSDVSLLRVFSWFHHRCVGLVEERVEYSDLFYIPHAAACGQYTHPNLYPWTAVKHSNSIDKEKKDFQALWRVCHLLPVLELRINSGGWLPDDRGKGMTRSTVGTVGHGKEAVFQLGVEVDVATRSNDRGGHLRFPRYSAVCVFYHTVYEALCLVCKRTVGR